MWNSSLFFVFRLLCIKAQPIIIISQNLFETPIVQYYLRLLMTHAPRVKSKHWVFTLNNPVESVTLVPATMVYLVVGKERGDEGTPHLQGYVVFKNRQYMTALKKWMPRAHVAIAKGTPEEASDYCKKDGDFVEEGVLPLTQAQGASKNCKRKWDDAWDKACAGNIDDIQKDMAIPYYHSFKRIRQDHPAQHEDLDSTCGIWFVGPTGCGKSRRARQDYPGYYDKPLNKWWDGYRDEPFVILDDMGPDQGLFMGLFLKRWTDHYPFPAEQKGTTVQIRPKQIIVTSQYTIGEVFEKKEDPALVAALLRRFEVIQMFPPCP